MSHVANHHILLNMGQVLCMRGQYYCTIPWEYYAVYYCRWHIRSGTILPQPCRPVYEQVQESRSTFPSTEQPSATSCHGDKLGLRRTTEVCVKPHVSPCCITWCGLLQCISTYTPEASRQYNPLS